MKFDSYWFGNDNTSDTSRPVNTFSNRCTYTLFLLLCAYFYFLNSSATAAGNDIEAVVHIHLHYFFDAVMPIIQAFYTKFYIPEKDIYPQEVENTDKLARALTVRAIIGHLAEYSTFKVMISGNKHT